MRPGTESLELRDFLPVRTLRVDVIEGPDAPRSCSVESERLTVGSAPGNDLVLADRSVSGYHAELVQVIEGVRVTDLGSTNGTKLASVRLERAVVPAGTVLELGRTRLRIADGDPALVELHASDGLGALRGRTPVMRRLMARIEKLAVGQASVLLVGETGTGKELIARALHERGPRAAGPFVVVDCGALVPTLGASELFGHEQGAFTGAHRQHTGAFERASGGTLFLDEVGELPAELQSQLLGVLDRRSLRRVGGSDEIAVDVRVVSATNRDLRAEVNAGSFRPDLYYRLAVVCLDVPPLRDRIGDVPLLVQHFLELCGHTGSVGEVLPPEMMQRLGSHPWPGNVRELRNVIEAALATGEAVEIPAHEGAAAGKRPLGSGGPPRPSVRPGWLALPYAEARAQVLADFQSRYLAGLLDRTKGNVARAAREAGMDRSHLIELLRKHGLR